MKETNTLHERRKEAEEKNTTQSKFIALFALSSLICTLGVLSYLVHIGNECHKITLGIKQMQSETLHTLDPVRYNPNATAYHVNAYRANMRDAIKQVDWR